MGKQKLKSWKFWEKKLKHEETKLKSKVNYGATDGLFGFEPLDYYQWQDEVKIKQRRDLEESYRGEWYGGNYHIPEGYMTQEKWDRMGRVGYGNNRFQEYSLDEKGYVYFLTYKDKPEYPEHLPYIIETIEVISRLSRGYIHKMAIAE